LSLTVTVVAIPKARRCIGWDFVFANCQLLNTNCAAAQKRRQEFMPKLKTHKGAAKRFKKTATGKIKRGKAFKRHILTSKDTKRKRHLDTDTLVSAADAPKVKRMIPY
jgi:large subunit ribosomal protein L35